ncbi:hypothetical protein WJX79_007494 [Trebouxia sp. C0005]
MHADSLTSQTDAAGRRVWYRTEDVLTNVSNALLSSWLVFGQGRSVFFTGCAGISKGKGALGQLANLASCTQRWRRANPLVHDEHVQHQQPQLQQQRQQQQEQQQQKQQQLARAARQQSAGAFASGGLH